MVEFTKYEEEFSCLEEKNSNNPETDSQNDRTLEFAPRYIDPIARKIMRQRDVIFESNRLFVDGVEVFWHDNPIDHVNIYAREKDYIGIGVYYLYIDIVYTEDKPEDVPFLLRIEINPLETCNSRAGQIEMSAYVNYEQAISDSDTAVPQDTQPAGTIQKYADKFGSLAYSLIPTFIKRSWYSPKELMNPYFPQAYILSGDAGRAMKEKKLSIVPGQIVLDNKVLLTFNPEDVKEFVVQFEYDTLYVDVIHKSHSRDIAHVARVKIHPHHILYNSFYLYMPKGHITGKPGGGSYYDQLRKKYEEELAHHEDKLRKIGKVDGNGAYEVSDDEVLWLKKAIQDFLHINVPYEDLQIEYNTNGDALEDGLLKITINIHGNKPADVLRMTYDTQEGSIHCGSIQLLMNDDTFYDPHHLIEMTKPREIDGNRMATCFAGVVPKENNLILVIQREVLNQDAHPCRRRLYTVTACRYGTFSQKETAEVTNAFSSVIDPDLSLDLKIPPTMVSEKINGELKIRPEGFSSFKRELTEIRNLAVPFSLYPETKNQKFLSHK